MEEYPFIVDEFSLKAFLRFEITYDEMTEGRTNVVFDDYKYTLDDIKTAIENIKAVRLTRKEFCEEWYEHVFIGLKDEFGITPAEWTSSGYFTVFNKEKDIIACVFSWCKDEYDKYLDKIGDEEKPDYAECLRTIRYCRDNLDLPVPKRKFTVTMKRFAVRNLGTTSNINSAPLERRVLFRRFVNELAKNGDFYGVRAKGFSLLFGNVCFKKDIAAAKRLFLDIYEKDEDPRTASLLGDMYYGSFDGLPDYQKAFQYYSVSGFDGNPDSLLKIAGMMSTGQGVVKNERVAKSIVMNLFDQTYQEFCRRNFSGSFAETSLMLADFCNKGIDGKRDPNEAFKYVNIARYAMNRRFEEYRSPVDEATMEVITALYKDLSSEIGTDPTASSVISEVPNLLLTAMTDRYQVHVEVRSAKNELKIVTRRIRKDGEEKPAGIFLDFPLIEVCELKDQVEEYLPRNSVIVIRNGKRSFVTDEMIFDTKAKVCEFRHKGREVAKIKANMYIARFR
ncbi:MAG: hypothetical protein K6F83_08305 [Clostridiales bacterium]|nr:hypothetical protein [Clostridiales bacterium]